MRKRWDVEICLLLALFGFRQPVGAAESHPVFPGGAVDATDWLDSRWEFRMKFTVVGTKIQGSGTFADFPLVLTLGPEQGSVFVKGKPGAADLVITAADGTTPLERQIVTWNPSAQEAEIWFRARTLSKTSREFYLYYGNADTVLVSEDPGTWSESDLAIYHFAENPGAATLRDWGPHGNHAVAGALSRFTSNDTIRGAIGQGWLFNGKTHWIDGDAVQSADSSFTISAWFANWNQEASAGEADFAFSAEEGFWHLSSKRNFEQRRPDFSSGTGFFTWQPETLPDTLLHHFVWTLDGVADSVRFYYDGVEQDVLLRGGTTQPVYTGLPILGNVGIAGPLFGDTNRFDLMEGIVDEYRIQRGVLRPNWIATAYNNMADPQAFYVFGAEQWEGMPVQLQQLTAERFGGEALIRWSLAATMEDLLGFHVHRGTAAAPMERLTQTWVPGHVDFTFVDPAAPETETFYWLAAWARSGDINWFGPVSLPAMVAGLWLAPNRPNPVRTGTAISFRLPWTATARLRIIGVDGRVVSHLLESSVSAGAHEIFWDGRDDAGRPVPSGVYFYQLESASRTVARKLLVNR